MAVTITDNRDIWNEGDSVTGWTSSTGKTELYTSEPSPVEQSGSIGFTCGIGTYYHYYTGSSTDLSNALVYVWTLNNGIMDTIQNGGIGLMLSDGTDIVSFHMAGSDKAAFRYDGISVTWQCLLIDTSLLPTEFYTENSGTFAGLDLSAITRIGAQHKNLAKALGGVENAFIDIIRYGIGKDYNNSGIEITGGTTNDRGNFEEIYLYDRSDSDQQALGIVRELATNVYGIQGILSFGTSGTGDSWFHDVGSTLIFEDRFVADDVYKIRVIGNTTGGEETHFILDGVTIQSARPGYRLDFDNAGIDELDVQNCVFADATQGIYLGDNADSPNHKWINNTHVNCGSVYPRTVPIINCTFSNVSSAASVSGGYKPSFVWDSQSVVVSASDFTNNIGTNACGILHTDNGTYNYYDLNFDNNTYDIIFLGTGTLTINNLGTSNATTYSAPNGGTVVINQAVNWTFTGIVSGSELRIQQARGTAPSGTELYHIETTDGSDVQWTFNYSDYGAGYKVDVIVHNVYYKHLRIDNVNLPAADASLPIQQERDRWYSNP